MTREGGEVTISRTYLEDLEEQLHGFRKATGFATHEALGKRSAMHIEDQIVNDHAICVINGRVAPTRYFIHPATFASMTKRTGAKVESDPAVPCWCSAFVRLKFDDDTAALVYADPSSPIGVIGSASSLPEPQPIKLAPEPVPAAVLDRSLAMLEKLLNSAEGALALGRYQDAATIVRAYIDLKQAVGK